MSLFESASPWEWSLFPHLRHWDRSPDLLVRLSNARQSEAYSECRRWKIHKSPFECSNFMPHGFTSYMSNTLEGAGSGWDLTGSHSSDKTNLTVSHFRCGQAIKHGNWSSLSLIFMECRSVSPVMFKGLFTRHGSHTASVIAYRF